MFNTLAYLIQSLRYLGYIIYNPLLKVCIRSSHVYSTQSVKLSRGLCNKILMSLLKSERVRSKWVLFLSKPISYLVLYDVICSNRVKRDEPSDVRITDSSEKPGDTKRTGPKDRLFPYMEVVDTFMPYMEVSLHLALGDGKIP